MYSHSTLFHHYFVQFAKFSHGVHKWFLPRYFDCCRHYNLLCRCNMWYFGCFYLLCCRLLHDYFVQYTK